MASFNLENECEKSHDKDLIVHSGFLQPIARCSKAISKTGNNIGDKKAQQNCKPVRITSAIQREAIPAVEHN